MRVKTRMHRIKSPVPCTQAQGLDEHGHAVCSHIPHAQLFSMLQESSIGGGVTPISRSQNKNPACTKKKAERYT